MIEWDDCTWYSLAAGAAGAAMSSTVTMLSAAEGAEQAGEPFRVGGERDRQLCR